jgi:hypothetical protein
MPFCTSMTTSALLIPQTPRRIVHMCARRVVPPPISSALKSLATAMMSWAGGGLKVLALTVKKLFPFVVMSAPTNAAARQIEIRSLESEAMAQAFQCRS